MSDAPERLAGALQPMTGTESRLLGDRASTTVLEPLEAMLQAGRCDCGEALDGHADLPLPHPWSYGRPCSKGSAIPPKPAKPEWNFSITGSIYGRKPKF